jgi:hypothetical protein
MSSATPCLLFRLPENPNVWKVAIWVSMRFVRGPVMDTRRSFYLAARQDDFDVSTPDDAQVDFSEIHFITPANDNARTKDRLSTRCGALLRRLIGLHRVS